MKIVCDSSVMYSTEEGAKRDLVVLPLSVSLGDKTWLEFDEISSEEFLSRVKAGEIPTSSSPPAGLILKAYDTDEEVLHIAMADGLSGAYEVARGLSKQARHPKRVHVINSRTLCVPHRIMVNYANTLRKKKVEIEAIKAEIHHLMDTAHSYLIPQDFDFLMRGGRLTPLAARIVSMLKAIPVMEQTEDGRRIERFTLGRKLDKVVDAVITDLKKRGCKESCYIGVSHADNLQRAKSVFARIRIAFPQCKMGIFELSPAFITQGGPECVAIQVIDLATAPDFVVE